jgi:hypothetical protein
LSSPSASPASCGSFSEQTPSPDTSFARMPSAFICLSIGPATASMPP